MPAFKIINLPWGSTMNFWITQLKLFLINITTTHEFGLPCEKNALPPHSFAHCFSESSFQCVSCRNITSAFLLQHQVNIVLLSWKLFMPLTFKETNLKNLPFKLCFIKMHILFGFSTFRCLTKHSKRVKQKTFSLPTEKKVKQNRTHSTFTYKLTLNKILNI